MIELFHIHIDGFEAACRGMRNPMNSWDKSDSIFSSPDNINYYFIGENDKKLMVNLVKSGSDHRKFMRMINVTMDINAPLFWWKEYDTYKVGTVANSCSTMHTIHMSEFTYDDFSIETCRDVEKQVQTHLFGLKPYLGMMVDILNKAREGYLKTRDEVFWRYMIELLPASYNQLRTVQLNYEVLYTMYFARKNHKLKEWRTFCEEIKKLPLMESFINAKENPDVY